VQNRLGCHCQNPNWRRNPGFWVKSSKRLGHVCAHHSSLSFDARRQFSWPRTASTGTLGASPSTRCDQADVAEAEPTAVRSAVVGDPFADPADLARRAGHRQAGDRYLVRDRDSAYGGIVSAGIEALGIEEVLTASRSPWQNPLVERVIGSIRRECLDHMIILNENHMRRILASYLDYCHWYRTHLSLARDAPAGRSVQAGGTGKIMAFLQVGGLHHRYERLAA